MVVLPSLLVAIVAATGSSVTYYVEPLGSVPDIGPASGRRINESGVVIGSASTPPGTGGGQNVAIIWDRTNGLRVLPKLDPSQSSSGADINNNGQLVGNNGWGCYWDALLTPSAIQWFENRPALPLALNDAGQIVGLISWVNFGTKAVLHANPQAVPVRLDDLPDDVKTLPFGINSQGQVVFHTPNTGFIGGPPATYLWTNGLRETLPNTPTLNELNGYDINDNEWIVGNGRNAGAFRPFLWRRAHGTIELPMPAGFEEGYAHAVNNQNVIAGEIRSPDGFFAALWQNGACTDLRTVVDESTADWHLIKASDINSEGLIIGDGFFDGLNRGFIARPVVFITHAPTQMDVVWGRRVSGNLTALAADDNVYVSFTEATRPRAAPFLEVVFNGTVPTQPIDIFQFALKSSVNPASGITVEVHLYDWTGGSYVLMHTESATVDESAIYVTVKDWAKFVGPEGQVRSKAIYRVSGFPVRKTARIDQAVWRVALQ